MGFTSLIADGVPTRAGSAALPYPAGHLGRPGRRARLLHMSYRETDLDGRGSDRLVDGLVAHGSREELQATIPRVPGPGADRVAVTPSAPQGSRAGGTGLEAMGSTS